MKKFFISILLVLFTIQPLIAQGLNYRNSELSVMMNSKSDILVDRTIKNYERESRNRTFRYALITSLSLSIIGGAIGINQSTQYAAGAIANTLLGATSGAVSGVILGIVWAKSTEKNTESKKIDRLNKLDRYDSPKSVDIINFNENKKKPAHEQIVTGLTKDEIIELIGKPTRERFIITKLDIKI